MCIRAPVLSLPIQETDVKLVYIATKCSDCVHVTIVIKYSTATRVG